MLTIYRRHLKDCEHREEGRTYRRCKCPLWVDGIFEGAEIRQSLQVLTWDDADRELEKLKQRLTHSEPDEELVTVENAWNEFLRDAESRNLRELTLKKYRCLARDMRGFAESKGLRFLAEFDLAQLRMWRSGCKSKNIGALKKLELVRRFFRFALDSAWIQDNPAKKLASPKVTPTPTLPLTREDFTKIFGRHR